MDPYLQEQAGVNALSPSDIHNLRQDYTMPLCRMGMQVTWYRYNHPDGNPQVGTVVQVSEKLKHIRVLVPYDALGEMKDVVYHVSDPILRLGREAAEGGCWDYTEDFLFQRQVIANMESRLADLEKEIAKVSPGSVDRRVSKIETEMRKLAASS